MLFFILYKVVIRNEFKSVSVIDDISNKKFYLNETGGNETG